MTGLALLLGAGWTAWSQSPPGARGESGLGPRALDVLTGSDEASQSEPSVHADGAGSAYRMWVDAGELRFQQSTDDGRTWSDPVSLDQDKPKTAISVAPSLAMDRSGNVLVMWRTKFDKPAGKDIRFIASPDRGVTWPGPVKVLNRAREGLSGMLSTPGSGHVYAVWYDERVTNRRSGGRLFEIFFNTSEDLGRRWLPEDVRLNTNQGAVRPAFISALPRVQSDGKGHVYVAWVDTRLGRTEIFARVSDDHGKTWRPEVNVSRGALSATRHQLWADESGRVLLVWADGRMGPSDIYLSRSDDAGRQWSEPTRISRHPAGVAVSAAPHMAVTGDGRVVVVWHDTRNGREDIYANVSADWGRTWLDKDIRLDRDDAGTGVSDFPQVVAGPDGVVTVAWADDREGFKHVMLTRSTDGGKTWLDREVRVDADTQPRESTQNVKLAAGTSGAVHVTWEVTRPEGLGVRKRVVYRRVVLPPPAPSAGVAPAK